MKRLRKPVLILLVLMLPWSTWAAAPGPCTEDRDPQPTQHHETVSHDHSAHGMTDTQQSKVSHHAVDQGTLFACPCCEECDNMCASMGCAAALANDLAQLAVQVYQPLSPHYPSKSVDPAPGLPFRPPISYA